MKQSTIQTLTDTTLTETVKDQTFDLGMTLTATS